MATIQAQPDGASYALHARLRIKGDRMRLDVHLKDRKEQRLWRGKYDGRMDDAFDWQDRTSADIADRIYALIIERELGRVNALAPQDRTWRDWVLRATSSSFADRASLARAVEDLRHAIALSPTSSLPYEVFLALSATAGSQGFTDLLADIQPEMPQAFEKAEELGGAASSSRVIRAYGAYVRDGDVAKARADIATFMRDMPFDPNALICAGFIYQFTGQPTQGLACFDRFLSFARFNNLAVAAISGKGSCLIQLGRFEEGLDFSEQAIAAVPGYTAAHRWRIAALAQLGRDAEARAALEEHRAILPDATIASVRSGSRYVDTPGTEYYFEGLRRAGMPES
ncbi:tetratricopeptide repeat protein [Sulfitobacter aestuariivivens]